MVTFTTIHLRASRQSRRDTALRTTVTLGVA
jgi:hypothetical protein